MHNFWKMLRASAPQWMEWFRGKAQTPHARAWLGTYSFLEALILPFPTDVFLALLVYADRKRAVWLTTLTTLTSVLGAMAGYGLAFFFYDIAVAPLASHIGLAQVLEIAEHLDSVAFIAVFLGALTPFPFTPVVFAAGLLHVNFFTLILASFFGRAIRYSLVTIITLFFGVTVLPRFGRIATTFTIVLCAIAAALLFLFIVFQGM